MKQGFGDKNKPHWVDLQEDKAYDMLTDYEVCHPLLCSLMYPKLTRSDGLAVPPLTWFPC